MKIRFITCLIILSFLLMSLSCSTSGTLPATSTASVPENGASTQIPQPSETPTRRIVAPASTIAPPTPSVRKLPWGTYRNIGEISDQFLENFQVTGGGAPPLLWFTGTFSITVDKSGIITKGTSYIHLFTNYTATGQPCDKGEYLYEADQANGTYDPQTQIITMVYTGIATYDPENVPAHCGNEVTENVELTVYFMPGEGNQYILCKTGEQGETCLQNPMVKLNP